MMYHLLKNRRNKKKSVLLVEDNKLMCELTTKILEKSFKVHPFQNAIDAINWLTENEEIPDAVISDINMSDMSGLEFGQYLKLSGLYSDVPLVYMSGLPEKEVNNYPIPVDYDAYTQKPFCPDNFVKTLENIINPAA